MLRAVILLLNSYEIQLTPACPNNAGDAVTRLDDPDFEYRLQKDIFLFREISKPPRGPTQPPMQWVSRFLLRVYKAVVA
jgi:hypothetical protein